MDLALDCWKLTKGSLAKNCLGTTCQNRRSADSTPANIVEGYGRGSRGDYVRFLRGRASSLKELETQLLLSVRKGLTSEPEVKGRSLTEGIGRLLRALYRSLL